MKFTLGLHPRCKYSVITIDYILKGAPPDYVKWGGAPFSCNSIELHSFYSTLHLGCNPHVFVLQNFVIS